MAAPWDTPVGVTALIVLIAALLGLLLLTVRSRQDGEAKSSDEEGPQREPGKVYSVEELLEFDGEDGTTILSRFVEDTGGEVVGETLALHQDKIILKKEGTYMAVGQALVLEREGTLVVSPDVDWDEARAHGDAWHKDTRDEIEYDERGMPVIE